MWQAHVIQAACMLAELVNILVYVISCSFIMTELPGWQLRVIWPAPYQIPTITHQLLPQV